MTKSFFETKYLGISIKVFSTHISYKTLFTEKSIPIQHISGIELGSKVIIETTSGSKHKISIKSSDKEKLHDAIYASMKQFFFEKR